MKTRALVVVLTVALMLAMALPAVAGAKKNIMPPVVSLDRVEVQNYFGFWHGTKEKPKAKGNCPLVWAFVFNVANPNSYPMMLETLKFGYAFDGYTITTRIYDNEQWIPAGKTNQVRVVSVITTGALAGNLAVTSGHKMKAAGHSAGALLKKWWTKAPDMSYPITIEGGTAGFVYDGGSVVTTFGGEFSMK